MILKAYLDILDYVTLKTFFGKSFSNEDIKGYMVL